MQYADGSTRDTNNLDPNKLKKILIVLIVITIVAFAIKEALKH